MICSRCRHPLTAKEFQTDPLPARSGEAIVGSCRWLTLSCSSFQSDRAQCGLDGGRWIRGRSVPHPMGWNVSGGRPATAFLFRCLKPKAVEKSWRRPLREDRRGGGGLRSDLLQSRPPAGQRASRRLERDKGEARPSCRGGRASRILYLRGAGGGESGTPKAPQDPTPVEAMAHRLTTPAGRALYALRKQMPEPVFGIIKSALGFRQFLLRGLAGARGEWSLFSGAQGRSSG